MSERFFETPIAKTKLPFAMLPRSKKDRVTGKWIELPPQPYLTVAHRIVWFREEHPDWQILTEIIEHTQDYTYARASIVEPSGRTLSMGHKRETKEGFGDHLEKAETSAVGRALALLGYGTAYALDLEEGDRLADAPIEDPKAIAGLPNHAIPPTPSVTKEDMAVLACLGCGTALKDRGAKGFWGCPNYADKTKKHSTVSHGYEKAHLSKMAELAEKLPFE